MGEKEELMPEKSGKDCSRGISKKAFARAPKRVSVKNRRRKINKFSG